MSRRRFLLRRVMVLAIVAVMVGGTVVVLGTLGGGGETSSESPPTPAPTDEPSADITEIADIPVDTPAETTVDPPAETTAPAFDGRVPTPDDPARVYIAGDSDAGTFGPYLERLLKLTGVVDSTLDYKVSSGLTRPDFYDWPARLREQIPLVNPDIVVVTFGGNDAQNIRVGERSFAVDRDEWTVEYRRRVGEVLDYLAEDGRTVIWVGIPNAASEDFTARLVFQRDAVVAELALRPHVHYVDTWERFSGRNGGYADFVIDPRDGMGKKVRAGDGFHLNVAGAEILALDIAEVVRGDLRARGVAI